MTITPDGWFSFAHREPGPADKVYSQQNSVEWFIPHSAVGYYGGWSSRLFAKDRDAQGRYTSYAAASIHGWNAYDGTFTQHYPITASCWGSGSRIPNTRAIAIENEGGPPGNESEPLTGAQNLTIVRILEDLAEYKGVGLDYWTRPTSAQDATATLYEHRECVRFGSLATACPSSRIDWTQILELLEDEMAPQENYPGELNSRRARDQVEWWMSQGEVVADFDEQTRIRLWTRDGTLVGTVPLETSEWVKPT